ncbi:MAG: DnaJ domain-containing protein [Dehalococcoidia bacterium]|uniref:DnaJ domain-containing protein n=1 Tax=Candidatus Amarobacter glycogenicus TaxID=3140699 RepID=UPI002A0F21BE|nr:DnaJ domain-containing protein [Dehalococcoidia bacterium]MBK7125396.1 DnaJ domain-containing protein [Dehalococcoidia bacterium]MBK7328838.1 DnaJ domain-containing protein [Dehalococcoidia bacterium]MBK9611979.1 DnaJ domain-containing protein [Dehalococcoidia bacterium]
MSAPNTTTTHYDVLEVSPSASPEVIEAAYKGLMRKYGEDPDPAVRERRRAVEEAFAVIGNTTRRAEYDGSRNGFRPAPAPEAPIRLGGATIVQCARHPEVSTALRCSRCDTPICPKCLIQTPVGARCKDCARIARSPVYTLSAGNAAKAAAASVVGGVAMGLVWGLVLMPFTFGWFSIFVGAGLGWVFTRILEAVTRRKRGPYMVGFAMLGIGIAWAMQLLFVPPGVAVYGLVAAGVACYFAYQNLR